MNSSLNFISALAVVFTLVGSPIGHAKTKPAQQESNPGLFQNGDRWTVVGDSITHGGTYYVGVYLYYATRFPELKLDLFNAGNSGDSADGGLLRYDWDIKPNKSTVATIMFGMNDVKRELYETNPPTPEVAALRKSILEGYQRNMTELTARLKADGARVVFVTPSIYDETGQSKTPVLKGVNGALAECSAIMRKLAKETGAGLIDFNASMTALNAKLQAENPTLSLIKPDRVHPHPLGHFVMTYLFLKGQQAPGIVSSVSIDAPKARVSEIINATVDKLAVKDGGVTFSMKEKALPYPVGKELEPALAWVPFQDEFNREILQVKGLPAGVYQLRIDGKEARRYNADELSEGVNLALERNTPQALQAAQVSALTTAWYKLIQEVRTIANFEYWRLGDVPHPVTFEAVQPRVEQEIERLKDSTEPKDIGERNFCLRYQKTKPYDAQNLAKLADTAEQIRKAAQPQPHAWELLPVKQ